MNRYLYNTRYSSHMMDVSDCLYNDYADRPHQTYAMFKDENTAVDLPAIRIKDAPYESFPISCSIEGLTDYLTSKGYSVVNWNREGYTGDSIVFYSYVDFTIASRNMEAFESIRRCYPERVIYHPEQLVLD